MANRRYVIRVALIVALGGFLMGFDASVISGVVGFIETEFALTRIQLGWSVASLTLTATLARMVAGPITDRFGRRPVLMAAAVLFAISAVYSALAPDFISLVIARMIGGFGVGSELTTNVALTFLFEATEKVTVGLGYRVMDIDYAAGRITYDHADELIRQIEAQGLQQSADLYRQAGARADALNFTQSIADPPPTGARGRRWPEVWG